MGAHNIQTPLLRPDHRFSTRTEPESLPSRPPPAFPPSLVSFDSPRPQLEFRAGAGSAPKPLESLHETPIPPFLSKTYDLTDDPSLDSIISWGERGESFVVWEPVEFARVVLPRNFKHNNFSSFVRQLNTYGFRKIDTDQWEFANGGFVRGQRHLLKTIQRRNSHRTLQLDGPCNEGGKGAIESEIKEFRRERRMMMEEVMGLQHEQRDMIQHMEVVKEKLEAAETRHKKMISFLARMLNSQKRSIGSSSRTTRKLVKHQLHKPELCNFTVKPNSDPASPNQVDNAAPDEPIHALEKGYDSVPTLVEQDGMMEHPPPSADEHYTSSLQNVVVENGVPGFLIAGDPCSMGLEGGDPWSYVSNYDAPNFGVMGGFLDVSEIGSLQLEGSSGIKKWLDEESPVNYI